ncbi:MAG: hypothetical protein H6994_06950 [Pseudomonadales bacterium]|nr:hypothetical protein [Pseudomonadales bacterium]
MRSTGWLRTGIVLVLTALLGMGMTAFAAEGEGEQKTRRVPTISEQVFKKLGEAQAAMDLKQYNEAINLLLGIVDARKYNTNEKGQMYNMLGFGYYSKEDYNNAIKYYKMVADIGEGVPEGLETQTLYTLAQLSFVANRYQDALNYMQKWITKARNPGHDPHIFMGQVYYSMKDYPNAIKQVETGIRIAKERGVTPKEQWYALLNFLYYEKEDWPKVISSLETLIAYWPKNMYWMRLAGVYGQVGKEKEQLWAMQAAHAAKMLERSSDYTNLAGLLMQAEVPYKASKVMREGIDKKVVERNSKNLQSLGQALQLAGDTQPAIKVFEDAATLSDDGKIYERLANLYLDDDKYDKCVTSANKALEKGGLRKPAAVHTVRGMCLYNQDQLSAASSSFSSCNNLARRDNDNTSIRICSQWIQFIERESERRRQLEAAQ